MLRAEQEMVVSVLTKPAFSVDVETCVEAGVSTRRFRWRLKAPGNQDHPSTQTFATRREAMKDGEIALERALQRGRLRP